MINREDLIKIGQFRKPHGTKGEITFSYTDAMANSANHPLSSDVMAGSTRHPLNDELACPFLICEIDGIFIPFLIENYRFISDSTAYITLKNIDSDQQARVLTHKEVFYPKKYISEDAGNDSFTWDYFIGFTMIDEQQGEIGRIIDVDKTTVNILFVVERENEEILIPAVEEFIIRVDESKEELIVALPEGLIE